MLKLKLQYFGHLMWRVDSLEKTLMLGKTEGRRRREQQRMRWLNGITDWMVMNLSKLWGIVKDGEARRAAVHGSQRGGCTEQLNNNKNVGSGDVWTLRACSIAPRTVRLGWWGILKPRRIHLLPRWACLCIPSELHNWLGMGAASVVWSTGWAEIGENLYHPLLRSPPKEMLYSMVVSPPH